MNRLTEAWFEWNGVDSREMGILLPSMPQRGIPAQNVKRTKVAGRSGRVRISDSSYDDITVKVEAHARDEDRLREIHAWLTGSGLLRFSDEPNLAYDAVIEKEFTRQSILRRFGGQRFTIQFSCLPIRYHYPEAADIVLTSSGSAVTNPGTAFSEPRVTIKGSGAFSVTIGAGANASTMFFRDVDGGGIIVDTQLGDALTYDGALLANDRISASELFRIQPGRQVVTWAAGGDAEDGTALPGSVEKITITPRWRSL